MTREFSITRELARREVESHRQQFIGVTASAPRFIDVGSGVLEWVCDVRVGDDVDQGLVKDALISQWAIGVVTDLGVPVLCERSEAGRVTVIGRSQIHLPEVSSTGYTLGEVGLGFQSFVESDGGGGWVDGFGHPASDPGTGGSVNVRRHFVVELIPFDDPEWAWGVTPWGALRREWVEE